MTEGQNSENMSDKPISGTQDRPSLSRIQVITGCTYIQATELMEYLESFNTRYEPTCRMRTNFSGYVYCSNCGYEFDFYDCGCGLGENVYEHNYCFNCGAKVIGDSDD